MDLRLLEVFCCVAECGSSSRAAQRLHLTQPTISGHIKSLEQQLRTRLFVRLGRRIQLTPAGELLQEHGERILEMRRVMVDGLQRLLSRQEGHLRLGASTIPGEYLLPAIAGRFHRRRPGIRVTIEIGDTRGIAQRVEGGEVEIGFVGARLPHRQFRFRKFAEDVLILSTPPTPRWRNVRSIPLAEARNEPMVVREPGSGTRMAFERRLAELSLDLSQFTVVAELGSTTAVKEAVKANVGVAVISDLAVRSELQAGLLGRVRIREIGKLRRDFFTLVHSKRALSPLASAFLEHLREEVLRGERR